MSSSVNLVDVTQMTMRARAYLATTSIQHWMLALVLAINPDSFSSASFDTIRDISYGYLQPWAAVFVVIASVAAFAALSGNEAYARWALTLSAVTIGFWAISFMLGTVIGATAGPSASIIWAAMVAKDLIVGAYPLAAPLEPLIRRVRQQASTGP